jgi:NTP pyrophosphatase (non-canonical NTP hydrolase)
MTDVERLQQLLIQFRKARDWEQFHNPKDIAISLSLEAAEVLEHFQWRSPAEIDNYIKQHKSDIGEELADVFNWILLLAHDLDIDILQASEDKIEKNGKKYPVAKAKGSHKKYTEY